MIPADLNGCFEVLGLAPGASLKRVRRRYRRLLFLHHPDHTGDDDASRRRFAEITRAYRALAEAFAAPGSPHPLGRCQACGELSAQFLSLDGNHYCRACAVDRLSPRMLPAPPVAVAACGGVILGLIAAAVLLICGARTRSVALVAASVSLAWIALVYLMVVCFSIRYTLVRRERSRAARM